MCRKTHRIVVEGRQQSSRPGFGHQRSSATAPSTSSAHADQMIAGIARQAARSSARVGAGCRRAVALDPLVAEASDAEPVLGAFNDDPMRFSTHQARPALSKAVVHSHSAPKAISDFLLRCA